MDSTVTTTAMFNRLFLIVKEQYRRPKSAISRGAEGDRTPDP